jgi:hypothetical protein
VDSPRPQNCIFVCRKEDSPGNRKAMG